MVTLKNCSYLESSGRINLENWLCYVSTQCSKSDADFINTASKLSYTVGEQKTTLSGLSCLQQGLGMAEILLELNLDKESIAAAALYNCVQDADLDLKQISEQLNPQVSKLIQGVLHMDAIHSLADHAKFDQPQLERIRKMTLAIAEDMRVVLIKLAERTMIMRFLHNLRDDHAKHYARETLDIYASLANRLGISALKWELEDLSFYYLEPKCYTQLAKLLKQRLLEREDYLQTVIHTLEHTLESGKLGHFKIYGRVKHIYSIYRKMQKKKLKFDQIYDLNAVRILVNNTHDCYAALSLVHSLWTPVAGQFDDYITTPKPNGYKSLHTAVFSHKNKILEIQIRTYRMHQESEHGLAAHWGYKEGSQQTASYQAKIAWLRQVLEWQKEWAKNDEPCQGLKTLLNDRIYVFTPKGNIIDLTTGATAIDFAYAIHTEVGHRCRGARVNGHLVPLTYTLNTGEQIEIITGKQSQPSRDWLNPQLKYLNTARARTKVQRWFKQERSDVQLIPTVHALQAQEQPEKIILGKPRAAKAGSNLSVLGINNLLTQTAGCCKPVPGDTIHGFITQGRGISVHRSDCRNILNLKEKNRLIEVAWDPTSQRVYPVTLSVKAYDRSDLVRDVLTLIANERLNLIALNTHTDKSSRQALIKLTLEISDLETLYKIMERIRSLAHVVEVNR